MEFDDDIMEDVLVCPSCGYSVELEYYGLTDDEYEAQYPSMYEVLGIDEEEDDDDDECYYGEVYDEVCGELDLD